ncbi:probable multidrug resistance-associated protein lethal(2)03659 [Macrosteles quadrilineatus]|uniref:probable multidrug resistance-associated protein lethal(2)03659 n=1 Tax=Macrosteles quadrilineatus TaxID=74068 RepID=UPI0023E198AD|nr:probable multidrug resistance-associated protein lethal(2)03659 [Macrosteles quadrilineatus]
MEAGEKQVSKLAPNPQLLANVLSRATVSWAISVFRKGSKKELQVEDLYAPLEEHRSGKLGDKLGRSWQRELDMSRHKSKKPSLVRALTRTFGPRMLLFGLIMVIGDVFLRIAQPLLLARMLQHFSPGGHETTSREAACWYALGVVVCTASSVFITNPLWLGLLHLAMKMRVACCSIVYRKSLRLSKMSLGKTTVGQVVNLMTNDVNRFDMGIIFVHYLWIGPLTTLVVMYFLWIEIGVAALVGVGALLVSIPAQMWLGKQKSVYRLRTAKRTDERICLMSEIINGISVIKMYTWEKPFEKLVAEARRLEIKEIRGSSYITGVMLSFLLFNNRLAIFCAIVTYVLMGNLITASIVYVVTCYFTLIRQMMSDFFPLSIGLTAEMVVSIKRIEKFMLYDEIEGEKIVENGKVNLSYNDLDEKEVKLSPPEIIEYNGTDAAKGGVTLTNISAKWSEDSSEETLSCVNVNFQPATLSVVIGPVGSGKSSLLQVVLKELPVCAGSVQVRGSVSYAAQEPWLFDGSVRQNIIFSSEYDESRYQAVINVCALRTDLSQLPHSDQTLVGDRGVVLSGGQRARINLARAIYREADVYLLDDPLSAVDTHVGKHLFEQCISGFLKGKTVILVTHQLQFLGSAKHIVLLNSGKVVVQGTYKELRSSGTNFSRMITDRDEVENLAVSNEQTTIKDDSQGPEMVEESHTEGTVSGRVFRTYLTGGGHWTSMVLLLFMFCLTQFVGSAGDYWLNYWVNLEEYVYHREANATSLEPDFPVYVSQQTCIIVFTVLIAATIVISLTRSFMFFYMCTRSSMWLHNHMFASVTRATMRFFHTNPAGRILNRFTKDMGAVDEMLPSSLLDVLQIGLTVVGIVGVLALVNVWLLIPTLVVGYVSFVLRNYYLKTSRGCKRLEGITRSPVFSHLNASLQGLSTIRAFNAESILAEEFDNHQDLHSSAFYLFTAVSRAFGFWLDLVCFLYIATVTFSFLVIDTSWLGGNVGLAVTQTVGIIGVVQWGMKQSADVENFMTSVERILEYTRVEKEPPLDSLPDKMPSPDWPTEGRIEFSQVNMAYDSSLPPVLKDLSFTIQPKEKVGIVGRTGAGKSSLTAALFRLSQIEGKISIDNIDVSVIGLHDLRANLSIIPQEPVLFSGTVRKNLDPFDEYSDHTLWSALEEVEMKEVIEDLSDGLNSKISEGGSNLSVGQRQLMCLARAIVRNNRILVMDEATANVDPQTDALIQTTIRRKFADCTVLTIAHRLNTVMDSDKILVMDGGHLVEFDHPHILLTNKHGFLYKMVDQLGRSAAEGLRNIAAVNYNQHIVLGRSKSR